MQNRLLSLLPADVLDWLSEHLQPVKLPRLYKFSGSNATAEHSYFLTSGIGSIVAATPEGQSAEIGIFGRDGMTPASLAAGTATTPYTIFMQVPGEGFRLPTETLKAAMAQNDSLRTLIIAYAHTLSVQTAYTAVSNAIHHIDERLARWILMCHDRTDNDHINLTHEFLSLMLAVRRPSVTTALHILEGKRLIGAERGTIIVRNRAALEAFASDAYGTPEQEYKKLIGPMKA